MVTGPTADHETLAAGPIGSRTSEPEATRVKTIDTAYEIVLRGQLDPPMLALIAEYDLGDTPAQVILPGLVVDRATLDTFLDRAHALGVVVTRIRPVHAAADDDPGTAVLGS